MPNIRIVVVQLSVAILSSGLTAACTVIKPELLSDARPPQDGELDAAPDAYVPTEGNLVSNPGLEQLGTTGWTTNGGGAVMLASDIAHGGTKSLLMTARAGSWNGPAVAITSRVHPGKHYVMNAWVRLAQPGTDGFNLSVRHICSEDGQHFNQQTTRTLAPAPDDATWVQPTSSFFVVDAVGCTVIEVLVYVETTTNRTDFYVDDLEVMEVAP